ncbi:MAG: cyclophilin-like fold protein [Thermoplasmata archaeon]|nr:cyclophilin-like fold protein [Thermoplasmata archaeon]
MPKFVIESRSTGIVEAETTVENPVTAEKIISAMPFSGKASFWGDEIYFEIPVEATIENGRVYVEKGAIAYWPEGKCLCIFFGKTLSSTDDRPKAYSPVNVFARVQNPEVFKKVKNGEELVVRKL